MLPRLSFGLLFSTAAAIYGADPLWTDKPLARWTATDARLILAESAWSKAAPVTLLPALSEAQLREGGRMGGGGKNAGLAANTLQTRTLAIRWESAAAIRAAELLAGETGAPDWEGDYYVIALYDVPGITPTLEKSLRAELKQSASLKRAGRRDVSPERVDIAAAGGKSARILYFFPRSAGITPADGRIEFVSRIGRLYVAQTFDAAEMQLAGKLEL